MARHVPLKFRDKLNEVQVVIDVARTDEGRHYDFGPEVLPGVRVVRAEADHRPIALSLWTLPADVAEICGDAAVPATEALLAIDRDQAHELLRLGVLIDLSQFTRSDSTPGVYYVLFDFVSPKQVHRVLHRIVPSLEPHGDRRLVA
ncbi:MAG: hypothetical protein ABR941_11540 [Thermoleophilia bacterium]|jgi:hypothetical protein